MFDIGFFELVVIAVIALIVLGPERLPHAVRMTGAWIGKIRRATAAVKEELEREVNAHEMQQRIKEQMEKSGLSEAKESVEDLRKAMEKNILEQQMFDTDAPDFGSLKENVEKRLGQNKKEPAQGDKAETNNEKHA